MIGILGKQGPPDEAVARAAQAAVAHPVPDMAFHRLGNVLLGIATRPDFIQESLSAPGEMVAALTGRIDNAEALYAELSRSGSRPFSPADADVVVAAFRVFGPLCVNRFRGAFAGIVTDGTWLHCFRDHIGFRPSFFHDDQRQFVVAGESRPVAVAAGIPQEPDLRVLERIVFYGMPSHTPAALKGVHRQPQATVISVRATERLSTNRYWFPADLLEAEPIRESEARAKFLSLLDQAVRRSMDGPTAVLLSGGLDSPAIAAFAAPEHVRRTGRPAGAISAVFPDLPSVDESRLVKLVAERFGMELHTYRPTARALDDIERWARAFASPTPTLSVPEVWDSYRRARDLGYRTVLTGEFAELTYGKWPHVLPHLLIRGRFRALWRVMAAEHARGAGRRELIKDALTAFVPAAVARWHFARNAPPPIQMLPSWMNGGVTLHATPRPDFDAPPWQRWRNLQLGGTEGSTITMESDAICATMAGVSMRRPFADIDLWEFFLRLPAEIKFPALEWKALARRALRGVIPDEIIDQPKKVHFDAHVQAQLDYPELRRLLTAPVHRIPGVNYELLAEQLERETLSFHDWLRARDLACVHAFLNTC